jgi:hypothetical protein
VLVPDNGQRAGQRARPRLTPRETSSFTLVAKENQRDLLVVDGRGCFPRLVPGLTHNNKTAHTTKTEEGRDSALRSCVRACVEN